MSAKKTLLELVQDVLRGMSSDNISALGDTEEADQVQLLAEETFYNLMRVRDWKHKEEIFQLTASGDNDRPTRMQIPALVTDVYEVRYDSRVEATDDARYLCIEHVEPDEFLDRILTRVDQDVTTEITDDVQTGLKFYVYTDRAPNYWTSFDDEYIWFDAYNSDLESTLQASKTLCRGNVQVAFPTTDAGTFDIPEKDFQLYYNMVVARVWDQIKEAPNRAAQAFIRRHMIRAQRENSQRALGGPRRVDYGRRR